MKKRIFIVSKCKFPREDAGANRILYTAKALKEYGFEVIIIGFGKENGIKNYNGVTYSNVTVKSRLFCGKFAVDILDNFKPEKSDIIIIYTIDAFFAVPVQKYAKRKKIICYYDIVERFRTFQYKFGALNPFFISFKYCCDMLYPKTGHNIVISKYLDNYMKQRNCSANLVLPVLTDVNDYEATEKHNTVFIYPGNPGKKDDMATMLKAIDLIEDKNGLEFHISGVKRASLNAVLGKDSIYLDKLKGTVILHDWLTYEELNDLFKKATFLLLSRKDNPVTRANFPSKIPELMACGIVPVTTTVGDISEYLTDGADSILFDESTPEKCRDAIQRILDMTNEQRQNLSNNAFTTCKEKFDYRNWTEKAGKYFDRG